MPVRRTEHTTPVRLTRCAMVAVPRVAVARLFVIPNGNPALLAIAVICPVVV